MIKRITFYIILTCICSKSFSQISQSDLNATLASLKDSQVVQMVRAYINSDKKQLVHLFPNYISYVKTLNIIKSFAKTKHFAMRPNYLSNRQTEKTEIVLLMSNEKYEIIGFIVKFTSNKMDSKIESISREQKFDQEAEKVEEISEL